MTDEDFSPEGEGQKDGPFPVLLTYASNAKVKVLSGLAALSYIAGREGDDEWDWKVEADDALIKAFFVKGGNPPPNGPRFKHYLTAQAALAAAYRSGRAQREIDLAVVGQPGTAMAHYTARQVDAAKVCERAMPIARARALIYASEVEFPADRHPRAIEFGIYRVAVKLAQRHALTDAEAAYCALKAFEEQGLEADWETAAAAMEGAASGRAHREAEEEDARERAAEIASATADLFGGAQ